MEGRVSLKGFEKAVNEKALFWVRMLLLLHLRKTDHPEITARIENEFRLQTIWTSWKKYDYFELTKAHPDVPSEELLGRVAPLDLDALIQSIGIPDLLAIFTGCLDQLATMDSRALEQLFTKESGSTLTEKEQQSVLFAKQVSPDSVRDLFTLLLNVLERESLFELKIPDISLLKGSWKSIRETGELRINYNMTDLMPLGNTVFLTVEPHDEQYALFVCCVRAADYTTKEEQLLEVYRSLVLAEPGVLNHYNFWSRDLISRMPVYELTGYSFRTQIMDFEFDFQRS